MRYTVLRVNIILSGNRNDDMCTNSLYRKNYFSTYEEKSDYKMMQEKSLRFFGGFFLGTNRNYNKLLANSESLLRSPFTRLTCPKISCPCIRSIM